MKFPFHLKTDGPGYSIQSIDIPEAISYGETKEKAIDLSYDCLLTGLSFYIENRRTIPIPSVVQSEHELIVVLPASVTIKILLSNEMINQRLRQVDLVKLTGLSPTQINRMLNLKNNTKIDSIDYVLSKMGKSLKAIIY